MAPRQQLRLSATAQPPVVLVAGVPWPRYKLLALIAGFATLLLVGVVTTSVAPTVLAAAAVGAIVGLALKMVSPPGG